MRDNTGKVFRTADYVLSLLPKVPLGSGGSVVKAGCNFNFQNCHSWVREQDI